MFAQVTFVFITVVVRKKFFASYMFLGFCVTFCPALFSNVQEFPSFPVKESTQRSRGWI